MFHRDRLILVGEQRQFGLQRIAAGDLTDHARVVYHHLAGIDALLHAFVEDHPPGEGVARVVKNLGDDSRNRLLRLHIEQRAQPKVLLFDAILPQQAPGHLHLLAYEFGVLRRQRFPQKRSMYSRCGPVRPVRRRPSESDR